MSGPRALLAALWALEAARATALRIGAFNIQSFGDSKVSDPACGSIIAKVGPRPGRGGEAFGGADRADPAPATPPQILAGYDLALVQEVRDPDLSAVSTLMEQINRVSEHEYSFVSSQPLGRDQYKEMYLFVYRKDAVSVVDTYQYPDPEDVFSREPFVVKFSAPGSGERAPPLPCRRPAPPLPPGPDARPLPAAAQKLVLIPLHAAPHQAVAEIDALYDVYLDVIDKWGTDDMLFLGDFNADCSYVRAQDWAAIRLRSSEVFKWLIPDSADTTVGNSDCAYDRIVACGARLRRSLKPQSATVHDFQEEFGLDQTQASGPWGGAGPGSPSPGRTQAAGRGQHPRGGPPQLPSLHQGSFPRTLRAWPTPCGAPGRQGTLPFPQRANGDTLCPGPCPTAGSSKGGHLGLTAPSCRGSQWLVDTQWAHPGGWGPLFP
uniref:Deoxyribonuclease-1-like 2 n=1 Tax=Papio anubis TaxID=9555 RepID=A0A8I5N876_PAPAN